MTPTEKMVSERVAAALRQLTAQGGTPKQQRERIARLAEVEQYMASRS